MDGVGEEICVYEDGVRGAKGGVGLEEEGGGDLGTGWLLVVIRYEDLVVGL